jgi:hypothetical protein
MLRPRAFVTYASLVLGVLVVSGAANTATAREEPASGLRKQVPEGLKQAKLESRLAEVARAYETGGQSAASAAAQADGLSIEGGLVRTVVVARNPVFAEAAVRVHGGVVEASYAWSLQVLVPPAALELISTNSQVAYVRPPLTPRPEAVAGEGVGTTEAAPWHAAGR